MHHGKGRVAAGLRLLERRQAYAVEDRCPHMGFPLHRGTVETGS